MRQEFADMRERHMSEDLILRLKLRKATACACKGTCSDCINKLWARTLKRFEQMKHR